MAQLQAAGLQEAIIVFNLLPGSYADPSWIDAPPAWRDRLASLQSPAARATLSDWLLARHGLDGLYDFEFSEVEKVMFLMAPTDLQLLSAKAGLLRHRDGLRRMIAGGTMARLAQEVGADAVQEGLAGLPTADFLPPPEHPLDLGAERLFPQLVEAGLPWLLGFLKPSWGAVEKRVRLKFPRALAAMQPLEQDEVALDIGLHYLKVHLLKREAL